MPATLVHTWNGTSTATVNELTATNSVAIPVDSVIFVAANKSITAAMTAGLVSISVDSGAVDTWTRDGHGVRSSTQDTDLWSGKVTTQIPAGSTFTLTWAVGAGTNRKVAAFAAYSGVGRTRQATSGVTFGAAGNVNLAPQGSGTAVSFSTSSASTTADAFSVAAVSTAGVLPTATNSWSIVSSVILNPGSTPRGVALMVRTETVTAVKTATATFAASASWAGGIAVYPFETPPPTGPTVAVWNGTTELPGTMTVWNGTTEVPVASLGIN